MCAILYGKNLWRLGAVTDRMEEQAELPLLDLQLEVVYLGNEEDY